MTIASRLEGTPDMLDLGLRRRRAVVVGAGFIPDRAGHGRAICRQLAAAGATVSCIDIDAGRAAEMVDEIAGLGGQASAIVADVTDHEEATRAIDAAADAMGGIDICVDVVGRAAFGPLIGHSNAEWNDMIAVNLSQVFYTIRAVGPHLVGSQGVMVAIVSVDATVSAKDHAAYGAAKAGVISLVKSLSDELGPHGVRVNAVAPGNVGGGVWDAPDVDYGVDPANSLAPPRPHDIANAVIFLVSDLAQRITGQTIVVDGGATTRSPWAFTEDDVRRARDRGLAGLTEARGR